MFGFIAIFVLNLSLLWTANYVLPSKFVILPFFGSVIVSYLATAFIWTFVIFLTQTVADLLEIEIKNEKEQFIAHFLANFIALWGIGRIGLGFGVSGLVWVFVIALSGNIFQYLVWLLLTRWHLVKM